MATNNRRTYVSNRIDLVLDDQYRIGAVQSVEVQMSFALEPISGVGSVRVLEWIPTMARISVNCDTVYIFSEEMEQVGRQLVPQRADDSMFGWVFDIYAQPDQFDVPGYGAAAYSKVWKAQGCSFDSGSFRVAKHGAVGRACSFMALDFRIGAAKGAFAPVVNTPFGPPSTN